MIPQISIDQKDLSILVDRYLFPAVRTIFGRADRITSDLSSQPFLVVSGDYQRSAIYLEITLPYRYMDTNKVDQVLQYIRGAFNQELRSSISSCVLKEYPKARITVHDPDFYDGTISIPIEVYIPFLQKDKEYWNSNVKPLIPKMEKEWYRMVLSVFSSKIEAILAGHGKTNTKVDIVTVLETLFSFENEVSLKILSRGEYEEDIWISPLISSVGDFDTVARVDFHSKIKMSQKAPGALSDLFGVSISKEDLMENFPSMDLESFSLMIEGLTPKEVTLVGIEDYPVFSEFRLSLVLV